MDDIIVQVAMKAIIAAPDGSILVLREAADNSGRTHPGKYEVPGGRLEAGETPQEALRREVSEESGLKVTIGKPVAIGEWRPVLKGKTHQIIGMFLQCTTDTKTVRLSDEHDDFQWIQRSQINDFVILQSDRMAIEAYFNGVTP
jgi:8-oxo-dGTP diphosphatase